MCYMGESIPLFGYVRLPLTHPIDTGLDYLSVVHGIEPEFLQEELGGMSSTLLLKTPSTSTDDLNLVCFPVAASLVPI